MRLFFPIAVIGGLLLICAPDASDRSLMQLVQSLSVDAPAWLCWILPTLIFVMPGALAYKKGHKPRWWIRESAFVFACSLLLWREACGSEWSSQSMLPWLLVFVACLGRLAGQFLQRLCASEREVLTVLLAATFILVLSGIVISFRDGAPARWSGWLDEPNRYGTIAGCGLLLALGGTLSRECFQMQQFPRGLALSAAVLFGVALIFSGSRGAIVATGTAAVFAVRDLAPSDWLKKNTRFGVLLVAGIGVAFVISIAAILTSSRLGALVTLGDLSLVHRLYAWQGAGNMIRMAPGLGVGWDNIVPLYESLWKPAFVPNGLALRTSDWLSIAAASGLPAMIGLAVAFANEGVSSSPTKRSPLTYCLLALMIGAAFSSMLTHVGTGVYCWLLSELAHQGDLS